MATYAQRLSVACCSAEFARVWQGDQVLCFDTHTATWSRVGVLPYGLSTMQTVTNGTHIITFGGEPETHHHGSECSPPHTVAA